MRFGDGIDGAPILARFDIGVAIGAGPDIAIDSADVILVKSRPLDIRSYLNQTKQTSRKMIKNLWWSSGYNFIADPLAAGLLAR
ncbi:hypothetical protein ACF3NG_07670 [Aerococcaceae bacterium WGS1372]